MSYDVTIGPFWRNYTSNVGKLFHKHIGDPATDNTGLQSLHGLKARDAALILAEAWMRINQERNELYVDGVRGEPKMEELYDAPSGWGSLVGALVFLGEITAACAQYPHETVSVSA